MVRAIRYWGEASTLLKEVKPPKERLTAASPTRRGDALLDPEAGADPYLELSGSLWLLHWWMLAPTPHSMVPLAWYAFNVFRPQEFNASDLEQSFFEECLKEVGIGSRSRTPWCVTAAVSYAPTLRQPLAKLTTPLMHHCDSSAY